VSPKDLLKYKKSVEQHYADLVYDGLWFSPLKEAMDAFIEKTQELVTGTVKVKLFKGSAVVVGRESPYSLYKPSLSTYSSEDTFDHSASKGFIYVWGLPLKVGSMVKAGRNGNGVSSEAAVKEEVASLCK
jgi:argininosuccinate synthase